MQCEVLLWVLLIYFNLLHPAGGIGTFLPNLMAMSSSPIAWSCPCLMPLRYSSMACQWDEDFSKLLANALNTSSGVGSSVIAPSSFPIFQMPTCHWRRVWHLFWHHPQCLKYSFICHLKKSQAVSLSSVFCGLVWPLPRGMTSPSVCHFLPKNWLSLLLKLL